MSQVTSQFGESFITGLLAGQKMRQFQSDLKTSEIQRKLLEQEMGYKQTMQPLLMAHQQAQLDREKTLNEGSMLANKLAEATYGDAVAESGSRAKGASAQARGATAEADVSEATKGSRISAADSKANEARTQLLQERFKTLGMLGEGGVIFNPEDIPHVSAQIFGPPSGEKATDSLRDKMAAGLLTQGKQKYDANQAQIAALTEANKAQGEARKGQAVMSILQSGSMLSDMASQSPEMYAAARSKLREMYGDEVVTVADLAVESARRRSATAAGNTTVTMDPADMEGQKDLGKNIETLYQQLSASKRTLASLEAGGDPISTKDNYWTTQGRRDADKKTVKAEIAQLEDQIKSQEGRKKSVTRTEQKFGTAPKSGDVPLITTQAAYDKLPAGARYRESDGGPIFVKPGS